MYFSFICLVTVSLRSSIDNKWRFHDVYTIDKTSKQRRKINLKQGIFIAK